jgi:hypothetical protein
MEMTLALAQIQKPVALSLYNDHGAYRYTVASEAVNAARLHGRCRVLVTSNGTMEQMQDDGIAFRMAVEVLEMSDEHFTVNAFAHKDDKSIMSFEVVLDAPVS